MNKYLRRFLMIAGFILFLIAMTIIVAASGEAAGLSYDTYYLINIIFGLIVGFTIGPKIEERW